MMNVYGLVVLLLVLTAGITISYTFLFNINEIRVAGQSDMYSAEEIVAASGINKGDNLLRLDCEKSEQMMAEAREDIEQQRSKMLSEMHEEIVNVAMTATEKLLNDKLNKKTDRKAVDEFIKEVTEK